MNNHAVISKVEGGEKQKKLQWVKSQGNIAINITDW